jgi:hypothetical protein
MKEWFSRSFFHIKRRIGAFIRLYSGSKTEVSWQIFVSERRDKFFKMGSWASCFGIVLYLIGYFFSKLLPNGPSPFSSIIFFPILTGIAAYVGRWGIERALHYQRGREILFILETAHWMCISEKAKKIFEGLEPKLVQNLNSYEQDKGKYLNSNGHVLGAQQRMKHLQN